MNIYNNGTATYTVGDIERLVVERDAALAQNAELINALVPDSADIDDTYWSAKDLIAKHDSKVAARAVEELIANHSTTYGASERPFKVVEVSDANKYIAQLRAGKETK